MEQDTASRVATEPGPPEVLTVAEAAALLRINEKTLREAITRTEVPGVRRIGRVIRLSRQALVQWLSGKSVA